MQQKILFILVLFSTQIQAQFEFSGKVTPNFKNATAYLSVVDNYNKTELFLTEQILQESTINHNGEFHFRGEFLSNTTKIYNIHIDNCHTEINDYKHLINHCNDSQSILFIAKKDDTIYFPLNDLEQAFCAIQNGKSYNEAIRKIDSLQELLLHNLQFSKSDKQRNITYKSSFNGLLKFSKTFNEPLAELYTYHLYSNNESIYNTFYLEDLKTSEYYLNLLERLNETHPKSSYSKQFKRDLTQDQYPFLQSTKTNYKIVAYVLGVFFLVSVILNLFFYKKNKTPKQEIINYKEILTAQEQKILELMQQKLSNKEIGNNLFISISTVKTHINNIYSKLKISSRKDVDLFF